MRRGTGPRSNHLPPTVRYHHPSPPPFGPREEARRDREWSDRERYRPKRGTVQYQSSDMSDEVRGSFDMMRLPYLSHCLVSTGSPLHCTRRSIIAASAIRGLLLRTARAMGYSSISKYGIRGQDWYGASGAMSCILHRLSSRIPSLPRGVWDTVSALFPFLTWSCVGSHIIVACRLQVLLLGTGAGARPDHLFRPLVLRHA